jgi:imidazole glycerol-phosphate synthase subunit HisH
MTSVAIVDYGMGNLRSVAQAVQRVAHGLNIDVVLAKTADEVMKAERIILPGQGAMRDCMVELKNSGMDEAVRHATSNKPLLGICVGMQMLFDHSEEQDTLGMGIISGKVKRFSLAQQVQNDGSRYKIPQIGWNKVFFPVHHQNHPIWAGIENGSYFYFVHSYFVQPSDILCVSGETEYGALFCSSLTKSNIFTTQFHPEKSAVHGLKLFENFLRWQP